MSIGAWGKRLIVDLAICREIGRYTCMHMLEANKVQRDGQGERGVARRWCERPTISRGLVCEYEIDEKRCESVHLRGTVLDIGGHGW